LLSINPDKTAFLVIGTQQQLRKLNNLALIIDSNSNTTSSAAKTVTATVPAVGGHSSYSEEQFKEDSPVNAGTLSQAVTSIPATNVSAVAPAIGRV
jgi:hypothetical protein